MLSLELYHHGVKGMHWGIIRTPEQLGHTRGKSKRRRKFFAKSVKKSKRDKNASSDTNKKAETKEEYEARKQKALKSGKASDIMKFRGDLTNKEMQDAINRIDLEKKLSGMSASEKKSAFDRIDKIVKRADQVNSWIDSGSKYYKTYKNLMNAGLEDAKKATNFEKSKKLAKSYLEGDLSELSYEELELRNNRVNKVVNLERIAAGLNSK